VSYFTTYDEDSYTGIPVGKMASLLVLPRINNNGMGAHPCYLFLLLSRISLPDSGKEKQGTA